MEIIIHIRYTYLWIDISNIQTQFTQVLVDKALQRLSKEAKLLLCIVLVKNRSINFNGQFSLWHTPAGNHGSCIHQDKISSPRWWIQLPWFPAGASHWGTCNWPLTSQRCFLDFDTYPTGISNLTSYKYSFLGVWYPLSHWSFPKLSLGKVQVHV